MRLDKFLQMSGLVPRRTRAKELCDGGLVLLDGSPARPARPVAAGQRLTLQLGGRRLEFRVLELPQRPLGSRARDQAVLLLSSERTDLEL